MVQARLFEPSDRFPQIGDAGIEPAGPDLGSTGMLPAPFGRVFTSHPSNASDLPQETYCNAVPSLIAATVYPVLFWDGSVKVDGRPTARCIARPPALFAIGHFQSLAIASAGSSHPSIAQR